MIYALVILFVVLVTIAIATLNGYLQARRFVKKKWQDNTIEARFTNSVDLRPGGITPFDGTWHMIMADQCRRHEDAAVVKVHCDE